MMDSEQIKSEVMEHRYKIKALEDTLTAVVSELKQIGKTQNRLIIALIVISLASSDTVGAQILKLLT